MPKLSEAQEKRLREKGLYLSFYCEGHKGYPNGIRLFKPIEVQGNSCPGYESSLVDFNDAGEMFDVVKTDALPIVIGSTADDEWYVSNNQFCGGPGPGDFDNIFDTEIEAVDDVIKFYFGEDERMEPYAACLAHKAAAVAKRTGTAQNGD